MSVVVMLVSSLDEELRWFCASVMVVVVVVDVTVVTSLMTEERRALAVVGRWRGVEEAMGGTGKAWLSWVAGAVKKQSKQS